MPQVPIQRIAEIVTLDPTKVPTDNVGQDYDLLSEFANRFGAITGKNWWQDPDADIPTLLDRYTSVSVRAASTANVNVLTAGLASLDGVTPLVAGDWVLLKNQTTGSENDIWEVTSTAWVRVPNIKLKRGLLVSVVAGTTYAGQLWQLATDNANIVRGTTSVSFTPAGTGGSSTADASPTTKGLAKSSTAHALSTNPIHVSDNDPRLTNAATTGAVGHVRLSHTPVSNAIAVGTNASFFETHLSGLNLTWVSGSALTVQPGYAWIPASGQVVEVTSAIAKTGLTSFTANTLYHVYLFLNSGTPDLDISTTAPVLYRGSAATKTGTTTHRYLGSVRSNAAGTPAVYQFTFDGYMYRYLTDVAVSPFALVNGGTVATYTTVSTTGLVPPGTHRAYFQLDTDAVGCSFKIAAQSSGVLDYVGSGQSVNQFLELDSNLEFQRANDSTGGGTDIYLSGYEIRR